MPGALKWGVCSVGLISTDFVAAVQLSPFSANHKFMAAAAREKKNAQAFAEKFNIPRAYGSYEELAADPDIDVVYIGTIQSKHVELSLLFLNHGKHVLCEKSMAVTVKGAAKVIETAKEKKLFFMEGFWSRTFPCQRRLREHLTSGRLGKPLVVSARMTVPISQVERIASKELCGGGALDLGCYVLCITNLVFPGKPVSIQVQGSLLPSGVDAGGAILVRYSCGGVASLLYDTRFDGSGTNDCLIGGTKGSIKLYPPFWCPTKMVGPDGEEEFPLYETDNKFSFPNSQGLAYDAEEVRQCLEKGLLESPLITHEDSLTIMSMIEEVLRQQNVIFT